MNSKKGQDFNNRLRLNGNTVSVLTIFVFINFWFAYKYSFSFTSSWNVVIGIITAVLLVFVPLLDIWKHLLFQYLFWGAIVLGVVFYLIFIGHLPRESLGVDRWSNIHSFWTAHFDGEYAYSARSHLNNPMGSFPFYFIYTLPFFLLDNFALLSVFGLLVVLMFFYSASRRQNKPYLPIVMLLVCSMPHLWEMVVRSSLLLNSTLVLLYVYTFYRLWPSASHWASLLLGLSGGMLLCTRGVFIVPFIALLIWHGLESLKKGEILKLGIYGLSFVIGFLLPFVPLMYNHLEEVLYANPLLVQSNSFIPKPVILISIGLSILLGFITKTFPTYLFRVGMLLFGIIVVYALNLIYVFGWHEAFFDSRIDLSYFIFCMPFLGLYLMMAQENPITVGLKTSEEVQS